MGYMAKVIQVGLGSWGFNWAQTVVPTIETAEAVAYVDAAPAALKQVQSKMGVNKSKCFTSLTEALASVECDLVLATLRTEAHHAAVIEALSAGVNVIVEKPFAANMAEAKEMVAVAKAKDRLLVVSQNYRYHPAPILAAELIAKRALGALYRVDLDFRMYAPEVGYTYWEMPDPLIADMSIHHFDLMRMVLGDEPKRVSCRTWNPAGSPYANDPIGVATVEFEKGTILSYRGSWLSGGAKTAWAGEWTMDCADGEIAWWSRHQFAIGEQKDDSLIVRQRDEGERRPKLSALRYIDRAGALAATIEALTTGKAPPRLPLGSDNLHSFALVQASLLSAKRAGDWVEIREILG
jgi:predicted dehydrogenase